MAKKITKATETVTPAAEPKAPNKGNTAIKGVWDFNATEEDLIDEVPVGLGRANNVQKLPIPWDQWAEQPKHVNKLIPLSFWLEGKGYGADDAKPQQIRDRLRRAFYGWQTSKAATEDRKALYTLALSDQHDPKDKSKYIGVRLYFQKIVPDSAKKKTK